MKFIILILLVSLVCGNSIFETAKTYTKKIAKCGGRAGLYGLMVGWFYEGLLDEAFEFGHCLYHEILDD